MSLRRAARCALALCAIAGAAPPASARADHGTTFLHETLASYMEIARAHWGGPLPTCVQAGAAVIPVHAVLYDDPDPSVAARADEPGCRIWLDRSSWREMPALESCMVIVHEWGHLLGHAHSLDPFDLMAEMPIRPPRACRRVAGSPRRASASAVRRCARHRRAHRHRKARRGRSTRGTGHRGCITPIGPP